MRKEQAILAITTDPNYSIKKIKKIDLLQKGNGTIAIQAFSEPKPREDFEYYEVLQVVAGEIVYKILVVDPDGFVKVYEKTHVSYGDLTEPLNEDPNTFLATNRLPTQPISILRPT